MERALLFIVGRNVGGCECTLIFLLLALTKSESKGGLEPVKRIGIRPIPIYHKKCLDRCNPNLVDWLRFTLLSNFISYPVLSFCYFALVRLVAHFRIVLRAMLRETLRASGSVMSRKSTTVFHIFAPIENCIWFDFIFKIKQTISELIWQQQIHTKTLLQRQNTIGLYTNYYRQQQKARIVHTFFF